MEFKFNVQALFSQLATTTTSNGSLVIKSSSLQRMGRGPQTQQIEQVIDTMGTASAKVSSWF